MDEPTEGTCIGDDTACAATDEIRSWYASRIEGYDDHGLRTQWATRIDGVTFRPLSILVTSPAALCHELLHAHLWRDRGDPCSSHDTACGWDNVVEGECKAAAPDP